MAPPVVQVSARIVERHDGRAQRFEMRLDPAELGKVDIRIEIGVDRKVHAVIAAHDSAALSDLMRGGKALEATLRDAGLDLADGGVKFEAASSDSGGAGGNSSSSANANPNGGRRPHWDSLRTFEMPLPPDESEAAAAPVRFTPAGRLNLVA